MTEPHDDLDSWLGEPVRPLMPPPGTFERIRRRARRRKLGHAALSAAGVVVIVVAAATVPRLVIPRLSPAQPEAVVTTHHHHSGSPRHPTSPAARSATPFPGGSSSPTPPPVPPRFQVGSVTFVGTDTGWVIGQAGTPGQCGPPSAYICTSIARTDDGGRTWQGVPAPVTGAPDGAHGIGQLRFLNTEDGWAFGPELWSTTDGGHTWHQVPAHGMRVIALEAAGQRAFSIWAHCRGTGPAFAADCSRFTLYSARAGSDAWQPVPGTTAVSPVSTAASAALVLTQARGYLLTPDGQLISGPSGQVTGWQPVTAGPAPATAPCTPGPAQPDGRPSQALFAATGQGLALVCATPAAGGQQVKTVYYSADGGATWQAEGAAPVAGVATSLSGTPSGGLVLATDQGIEVSHGVSGPWQAARGASPPGGFSFVGMTFDSQGVAVPADPRAYSLWITHRYALAWSRSPVSSP
jgi:photosystem II stability/assembly factor-like uncharacterized protein